MYSPVPLKQNLVDFFHNAKETCPIRITLEELGYPQPPTPLQTDNLTAAGISNDTIKQKRSKAIDMRFDWLRDRVHQGRLQIYWSKGAGKMILRMNFGQSADASPRGPCYEYVASSAKGHLLDEAWDPSAAEDAPT